MPKPAEDGRRHVLSQHGGAALGHATRSHLPSPLTKGGLGGVFGTRETHAFRRSVIATRTTAHRAVAHDHGAILNRVPCHNLTLRR